MGQHQMMEFWLFSRDEAGFVAVEVHNLRLLQFFTSVFPKLAAQPISDAIF
jgi:hypothetical protein